MKISSEYFVNCLIYFIFASAPLICIVQCICTTYTYLWPVHKWPYMTLWPYKTCSWIVWERITNGISCQVYFNSPLDKKKNAFNYLRKQISLEIKKFNFKLFGLGKRDKISLSAELLPLFDTPTYTSMLLLAFFHRKSYYEERLNLLLKGSKTKLHLTAIFSNNKISTSTLCFKRIL